MENDQESRVDDRKRQAGTPLKVEFKPIGPRDLGLSGQDYEIVEALPPEYHQVVAQTREQLQRLVIEGDSNQRGDRQRSVRDWIFASPAHYMAMQGEIDYCFQHGTLNREQEKLVSLLVNPNDKVLTNTSLRFSEASRKLPQPWEFQVLMMGIGRQDKGALAVWDGIFNLPEKTLRIGEAKIKHKVKDGEPEETLEAARREVVVRACQEGLEITYNAIMGLLPWAEASPVFYAGVEKLRNIPEDTRGKLIPQATILIAGRLREIDSQQLSQVEQAMDFVDHLHLANRRQLGQSYPALLEQQVRTVFDQHPLVARQFRAQSPISLPQDRRFPRDTEISLWGMDFISTIIEAIEANRPLPVAVARTPVARGQLLEKLYQARVALWIELLDTEAYQLRRAGYTSELAYQAFSLPDGTFGLAAGFEPAPSQDLAARLRQRIRDEFTGILKNQPSKPLTVTDVQGIVQALGPVGLRRVEYSGQTQDRIEALRRTVQESGKSLPEKGARVTFRGGLQAACLKNIEFTPIGKGEIGVRFNFVGGSHFYTHLTRDFSVPGLEELDNTGLFLHLAALTNLAPFLETKIRPETGLRRAIRNEQGEITTLINPERTAELLETTAFHLRTLVITHEPHPTKRACLLVEKSFGYELADLDAAFVAAQLSFNFLEQLMRADETLARRVISRLRVVFGKRRDEEAGYLLFERPDGQIDGRLCLLKPTPDEQENRPPGRILGPMAEQDLVKVFGPQAADWLTDLDWSQAVPAHLERELNFQPGYQNDYWTAWVDHVQKMGGHQLIYRIRPVLSEEKPKGGEMIEVVVSGSQPGLEVG
ncbi:MAG TPA: hypothetical protein VMW41_02585 [Candidatus Bathyarchaeia archaeon]|nr:hypothetical protein [Candidatus Bathyarchaeia archaeon]